MSLLWIRAAGVVRVVVSLLCIAVLLTTVVRWCEIAGVQGASLD